MDYTEVSEDKKRYKTNENKLYKLYFCVQTAAVKIVKIRSEERFVDALTAKRWHHRGKSYT